MDSRTKKELVIPLLRRHEEERILQQAWQEVKDERAARTVLVCGDAGTGKTSLVESALPFIKSFKSSATNINASPFMDNNSQHNWNFTLRFTASSFDGIRIMVPDLQQSNNNKENDVSTCTAIQDAVTPDQREILKTLSGINNEPNYMYNGQNTTKLSTDSMLVVSVAIKAFLRAIASFAPMILLIEDIQCMSDAALDALKLILLDLSLNNLLLIANYTTDDESANPSIETWIGALQEDTSSSILKFVTISLENLQPNQLLDLLEDATNCNRGNLQALAETILQFTEGNPFFVKHYLEKLTDNNLLVFDWNNHQWTFDIEAIRRRSSFSNPDLVQTLLKRLREYDKYIQTVLSLAASFGIIFDIRALRIAKQAIDSLEGHEQDLYGADQACNQEQNDCKSISSSVEQAVRVACQREFIIPITDTRFKFAHNLIRLAAYGMLPDDPRIYFWTIGKALLEQGKHLLTGDTIFFAAVDLLNAGIDHGKMDTSTRTFVSEWNLEAGKRAAQLSSFLPANRYLKLGLQALECLYPINEGGDNPRTKTSHSPVFVERSSFLRWKEDDRFEYQWTCLDCGSELAAKLYGLFSQTLFCLGKIDESLRAAQNVMDHSPFECDKLQALSTIIQCHYAKDDGVSLLTFSLETLAKLGEQIPSKPRKLAAQFEFYKIKRRLQSLSNEQILSIPMIADTEKEAALVIMTHMSLLLDGDEQESLVLMVVSRMTEIILKHGICPAAPEALALAAVFLAGTGKEIRKAYRIGRLAEDMIQNRFGGVSRTTVQAYHMLANGSKWWMEPVPKCLDMYLEANKIHMEAGEVALAFRNTVGYLINYFYSGLPIIPLLEDIEKFSSLYLEYKQLPFFLLITPLWQCLLNLTGKSKDPLDMEGGEAIERAKALNGMKAPGPSSTRSYQMQLAFYLGDLPKATKLADDLADEKAGIMKSSFWFLSRKFFLAIVAISNYKTRRKLKYKLRAESLIRLFEKLVNQGAINLVHKLQILTAEWMAASGPAKPNTKRDAKVLKMYENAVVSATRAAFLQDSALACYLCFLFIQERDMESHLAEEYLARAVEHWLAWGGTSVANSIYKRHSDFFSRSSSLSGSMQDNSGSRFGSLRSRPRFDPSLANQHKVLAVSGRNSLLCSYEDE